MNNSFFPFPYQAPRTEVPRVSGRGGAEAFPMGPNSSAMPLDESGTLVWLITTDSAGFKTITPYDITPHQAPPAPDLGSLEARIKKLEDKLNDTGNSATA